MTSSVPDVSAPLPTGGQMPLLGFGTWELRGPEAVDAVATAFDVGYRHVDTAAVYGNEAEVGDAVRRSGLERSDVFLTTKMPGGRGGEEGQTLQESLRKLGTDYLDLWLIHWPAPSGADVQMWQALIQAAESGAARAIGVSNYSLAQIDDLVDATGVVPAVNQIEWSPLLFDSALLDGHRERGVLVEGYSGFRKGALEHPVINEIAREHDVSAAQVIVRWHLQHGVVVIPKSAKPERIRSNADVGELELSAEDMARLDGLSRVS